MSNTPDLAATRPVIRGRRLVVSCGHYLAAGAGLRMLERGGNAVDAGVAMVLAQAVLEPQTFSFGGESPILIYSSAHNRVAVIDGHTRAPAAASIGWYRSRGISLIPGDGFLPAGVPAVCSALLTALDRFGTLSLADVAGPAIELAYEGFPVYEQLHQAMCRHQERFRAEWPSSGALLLPGGQVPQVGHLLRNPWLGQTLERLAEAEHAARSRGRSEALRAAHDRFYQGDIARTLVAFQRDHTVRDSTGCTSAGLLSEADLAGFRSRVEEPVRFRYRGYDVYKPGPWCQGPVFLQQLALLSGFDLRSMGHNSAPYIHLLVEAAKLAFADREQYYGDPEFTPVPMEGLLSPDYASERRSLIDLRRAAMEVSPGNPWIYQGQLRSPGPVRPSHSWGTGTTGTRAVDAAGNLFSATPSGGWFHTSSIIEGLGFALGTRCQAFTLDDPAAPSALMPGKRPRTTLSPTLVMKDGRPCMAFGTEGGDKQDQWTLQFFLNTAEFNMDLQDAIDAPLVYTEHLRSSFYPRGMTPGRVVAEGRLDSEAITGLRERGHDLRVEGAWSQGFVTAVAFDPESGTLSGAASSRGEKYYAAGW